MTCRRHVQHGQIALDDPARLPEGAEVNAEVVEQAVQIICPKRRKPLRDTTPIKLPGGPLPDDIVRHRP